MIAYIRKILRTLPWVLDHFRRFPIVVELREDVAALTHYEKRISAQNMLGILIIDSCQRQFSLNDLRRAVDDTNATFVSRPEALNLNKLRFGPFEYQRGCEVVSAILAAAKELYQVYSELVIAAQVSTLPLPTGKLETEQSLSGGGEECLGKPFYTQKEWDPKTFPSTPIEGEKTDLAWAVIRRTKKDDSGNTQKLELKSTLRHIQLIKITTRIWRVYFKTEDEFKTADLRLVQRLQDKGYRERSRKPKEDSEPDLETGGRSRSP